jgi:hypothetical protein
VPGSPRLTPNELAREIFLFGEEHRVTLSVEWVPMEQNSLADELSKLIIPQDRMIVRSFFRRLEKRQGAHAVDLFPSDANNQCGMFYSLQWCRRTAGVNAFAYFWAGSQ